MTEGIPPWHSRIMRRLCIDERIPEAVKRAFARFLWRLRSPLADSQRHSVACIHLGSKGFRFADDWLVHRHTTIRH